MKLKRLIEVFLYVVIIVLALIAIGLVINSPPDFIKNKPVYGGF
jgi:hypothetical protein